jgi:hypothetical protein
MLDAQHLRSEHNLGLNVCTVTTGLESFILPVTPCISGNVAVWGFTDNACANLGTGIWDISASQCYASSSNGAIAAIMLTCDANADETAPSAATATTTVSVGPVANSYPTSTSTPSSSSGINSTPNSNASPWDQLQISTRVGIIVGASFAGIGVTYLVVRGSNPQTRVQERMFEWVNIPVTRYVPALREVWR